MSRPDGSNEPTRLPNLSKQEGKRFAPADPVVDLEALAEDRGRGTSRFYGGGEQDGPGDSPSETRKGGAVMADPTTPSDDILIAIQDGRQVSEATLRLLPPWRAALLADVAVRAGMLDPAIRDGIRRDAIHVGGEGTLPTAEVAPLPRAGDPRPASAGRRRNPPMDAMEMREAADAVQDREER